MPERVIDVLEVVEIDQKSREFFSRATRERELVFDALDQLGAIDEAGHGVVVCEISDSLFGAPPLRNVFVSDDPTSSSDRMIDYIDHATACRGPSLVFVPPV